MGLAERKVKQRIGYDPRNLAWANDTDRFAYKRMTALGWSDSQGIGRDATGNPNHISVERRLDNGGIGMGRARKEGEEQSVGAGRAGVGLDDVLKRLASGTASPVSASPSPAPESEAGPSKVAKNKIASRQRHLHSKRLASSSPAALAEILGVPVDSLPVASTSGLPGVAALANDVTMVDKLERSAAETVSTSSVSVTDYFRQKMREKALARQAASGLPAISIASTDASDVEVTVVQAEWQGTRTTFAQTTTDLVELGGEEVAPKRADEMGTGDVKGTGDREARKEAKRLRKIAREEKRAAKAVRKRDKTAACGSSGEHAKKRKEQKASR